MVESSSQNIEGEQGEVDPVRTEICKQVSEVIEAMERVKLLADRLLDSREQHPELTDDVLSRSRLRIGEVIESLGKLQEVAKKLDKPILTAPGIERKPSLVSAEITTCRDPAIRRQVKAEPVEKIELNRPMVQAILNRLSGELLEVLKIGKTRYAIMFMTYLLWKGEGVESTFAEFFEFTNAESMAEKTKITQSFIFVKRDFQKAGIIDFAPNSFKLLVGKLPQLDAEQIKDILEKTAIGMGESALSDAAITLEVLMRYLEFLQDLPLMKVCAKLRAGIKPTTSADTPAPPSADTHVPPSADTHAPPSELSPIADATPPSLPPTVELTIAVAATQTMPLPPTPMPQVPDTSTPAPSPSPTPKPAQPAPAADVAPTLSPRPTPPPPSRPTTPTTAPRTSVSRSPTPVVPSTQEPRRPISPRAPATVSAQAQQASGVIAGMPQAPRLEKKRPNIRSPRETSSWMGSSEMLKNSQQDKSHTIRKNYKASSQGLDENATYEIKLGIKGYEGLRGEHVKILPLRTDTEAAYLEFGILPEGYILVIDEKKKKYRVHKDALVLIPSATQPSSREPSRQRQGNTPRGNPKRKTDYPIPEETGTACELTLEAREKRKGDKDPLTRPFIVIDPNDSEAQDFLSRLKDDRLKKTIAGIKNEELVIVRAQRDQETLYMIVNHNDIRQLQRKL